MASDQAAKRIHVSTFTSRIALALHEMPNLRVEANHLC